MRYIKSILGTKIHRKIIDGSSECGLLRRESSLPCTEDDLQRATPKSFCIKCFGRDYKLPSVSVQHSETSSVDSRTLQ